MSTGHSVHILQVGANDGVLYDPIHKLLQRKRNITATRIEPLREYFEELQVNCQAFASRVELLNFAIGDSDGFVELHFPDPRTVRPDGEKGHASINPEAVGRSRDGWMSRMVPCKSMKSLINEMASKRVDVYVSDCEGYDVNLLAQLPIASLGVKVIFIELAQRAMAAEDLSSSLKQIVDIVVHNGFNRMV
ncbi:MAG: FkbM family methyltransferase, partial [Cyanobacteriota bacterium]|nr:FkbM family methyltransferase [Cyanobacteriota bacterium]